MRGLLRAIFPLGGNGSGNVIEGQNAKSGQHLGNILFDLVLVLPRDRSPSCLPSISSPGLPKSMIECPRANDINGLGAWTLCLPIRGEGAAGRERASPPAPTGPALEFEVAPPSPAPRRKPKPGNAHFIGVFAWL